MPSHHETPPLIIGVDVGGTNTDAVALRGSVLLASSKVPTTADVTTGVRDAVLGLVAAAASASEAESESGGADLKLADASAALVGTTSLVNALLEGRGLSRVAVVRLCGPSSRLLPPYTDFPPSLRDVVSPSAAGTTTRPYYLASGGLRFNGEPDCDLDEDELGRIASEIAGEQETDTGVDAVVVSGTFSPSDDGRQERRAADVLRRILPPSIRVLPTSSSSSAGRLGLLARENSAVLDAALSSAAKRAARSARDALRSAGLSSECLRRLHFTANDGSVLSFEEAARNPLRCAACGPTNSLRGAAFLSSSLSSDGEKAEGSPDGIDEGGNDGGALDRIVLDVGGTSTDAGCLVGGRHPRDANSESFVAGVRCNHRATDVVSVALGGGSVVSPDGRAVGPESVGTDIGTKALCFGGTVCTATCVAAAMGADMSPTVDFARGCQRPRRDFDDAPPFALLRNAWETMQSTFFDLVQKARTDGRPVEVVVVGGGAGLVDGRRLSEALGGGCSVVIPKHAAVANAAGAALARAVGEAEAIADLSSAEERDAALTALKAKACARAGGGPEARVIECEEVPIAYLPGKMTRVSVRAVASLNLSCCADEAREEEEGTIDETCGDDEEERYPAMRLSDPPRFVPSPPDVRDGVWYISEYDAHCISIGAGILGCGGGGSTHHGLLMLLSAIREGSPIRVVSANSVPDDAPVVPCGFMGAPTVMLEMITNPEQLLVAVRRNLEVAQIDARAFVAVTEIGGGNGLKPLLVGGMMDRPVVDADLMGRAFPELQMMTTAIYGLPQTPTTVSDAFGRCVSLRGPAAPSPASSSSAADDFGWNERVLRPVSVEFGCFAGLADPPLPGADLRRVGICGSLTRARRIGDCVLRSSHPTDAIDNVLAQEGGRLLFAGRVTDVRRETTAGFAKGRLKILGEDKASVLEIEFQNEFIFARLAERGEKPRIVGCVPDIISLVDADSARPVATEEVRFGFRVHVILLPISSLLRSVEALRAVGPKAFGLDSTYHSPLYDGGGNVDTRSFADM